MQSSVTRRVLLGGGALLLPSAAMAAGARPAAPSAALAAMEKEKRGLRLGVAVLDTGSGRGIFYRQDERFVMCSTFKMSLAAATLARVDRGAEKLDRLVHYDKSVPLGYSPATKKNVGRGMTVAQLCEAAVIYSDNGAANLLLAALGGPAALTAYWRGIGDTITRLDDNEPKLNTPNGVRNTTTPRAMMGDLKTLLLDKALSAASRARLLGWMRENTTGANRIRAGVPAGWQVGDKTGTGADGLGLVGDIGIIMPPGRKPILAALYAQGGDDKTLADAAGIIAKALA